MVPVVITIKNGIVDSVTLCRDLKHAEEVFIQEVSEHGIVSNSEDIENWIIETPYVTISINKAMPPEE